MNSEEVEWEVILDGNHSMICVYVDAPADVGEVELLSLAEQEAMRKTYIYSKRQLTNTKNAL